MAPSKTPRGASRPSTGAVRASRVAAELSRPIATTQNGRDITRPWTIELEQARDPRLLQAVDWGVYDVIARDTEVRSTFQQRRRAVTSAEWDVLPGDGEDARSVEAAEKLKANLERVGLDRITDKMLWSVMNGYAVGELMWEAREGLIQIAGVRVRHARRFRRDQDGNIRLLTSNNMRGELLPERKFWWVSTGASDDDDYYGRGLAADLYWPTLMKRNGLGFWNVALDKFGTPTAKGTYRRGSTQKDIDKLLQAIEAIANDSGFVIPEGMQVELLEAGSKGDAGFEKLVRYCDECIAKVVLSQTMTSADGSSHAQAKVHAGVKLEVVTGDADLVCEGFNDGPARWWTDLNYGADVQAPQLVRLIDEEEDLKARAETDVELAGIGWVRTEESFKDTYGDGYERKQEAAAGPAIVGVNPRLKGGEADNVVPIDRAASFAELGEGDSVDQAVAQLIAGSGYTALAPIMAPIADAIVTSETADQLDEALIRSLGQSDVDRLTEALAQAGFAVRVAAELGVDQ